MAVESPTPDYESEAGYKTILEQLLGDVRITVDDLNVCQEVLQ
jgi:hypothetical protein